MTAPSTARTAGRPEISPVTNAELNELRRIRFRYGRDEGKRLLNLQDARPSVLWCNTDAEQAHKDRGALLDLLKEIQT